MRFDALKIRCEVEAIRFSPSIIIHHRTRRTFGKHPNFHWEGTLTTLLVYSKDVIVVWYLTGVASNHFLMQLFPKSIQLFQVLLLLTSKVPIPLQAYTNLFSLSCTKRILLKRNSMWHPFHSKLL